jgi:hypothetical protein
MMDAKDVFWCRTSNNMNEYSWWGGWYHQWVYAVAFFHSPIVSFFRGVENSFIMGSEQSSPLFGKHQKRCMWSWCMVRSPTQQGLGSQTVHTQKSHGGGDFIMFIIIQHNENLWFHWVNKIAQVMCARTLSAICLWRHTLEWVHISN